MPESFSDAGEPKSADAGLDLLMTSGAAFREPEDALPLLRTMRDPAQKAEACDDDGDWPATFQSCL